MKITIIIPDEILQPALELHLKNADQSIQSYIIQAVEFVNKIRNLPKGSILGTTTKTDDYRGISRYSNFVPLEKDYSFSLVELDDSITD